MATPCSVAAGAATDVEGPGACLADLDRLDAALEELPAQQARARVEGGPGAPAGGDDRVSAGTQHHGDLGEERRHVELGDEIERLVRVGQGGGVAELEGDPALRVEPDLRHGGVDHLL